VRKLLSLDAAQGGGNDLTRINGSVALNIRRDDPLVQNPTELERM
jgi:hypothetical protein